MERLRVIVAAAVLPAALACFAALVLVLGLVRAPARWIEALHHGFTRLALFVGGTPVDVHGREHVDRDGAYVIVPNHESTWDPVVLVHALAPLRVRFVVKEAIARLPIVGLALRRTGNVMVCRADTAADVARLRDALRRRDPGTSVLFFAEGTRSRDGALHGFKLGAFAAALAADLPILPVGIAGTRAVLPPDTLDLHAAPIVVEIGHPIAVAGGAPGAGDAERIALRDATHDAVRALRHRARHRLRFLQRRTTRTHGPRRIPPPPVAARSPHEAPPSPNAHTGA